MAKLTIVVPYFRTMQIKSNTLVAGAIITLIALTSIQLYLMQNSLELKRKSFSVDARTAIAKVYNTAEVDSVFWLYRNDFLENLERYQQGKIDSAALLASLKTKCESINPQFQSFFAQGFNENGVDLSLELKIVTSSIVISDTGFTNVLLNDQSPELVLLGDDFATEKGVLINNSAWQKDHDFTDQADNSQFFNLVFQTQVYMNINNWEEALIHDLSGLFVAVFILFVILVLLVYYSIRNLLKQKKIASIKTDFINNITHELKTPLSTLSIATKTLSLQYDDNEGKISKEAIDIIDRQSLRLQKLFDQVVDNSVGYKDIELTKETLNVAQFLTHLINDYVLALDKRITITRNFNASSININADKFYLETAIINIVNNAVKYGASNIVVDFKINENTAEVSIIITDNGIGIDKKYHQSIFEKFYRVAEKDTHNYKGLGLGLYYSHQVLKAHYGNITLNSKIGVGSSFYLNLPIKGGGL